MIWFVLIGSWDWSKHLKETREGILKLSAGGASQADPPEREQRAAEFTHKIPCRNSVFSIPLKCVFWGNQVHLRLFFFSLPNDYALLRKWSILALWTVCCPCTSIKLPILKTALQIWFFEERNITFYDWSCFSILWDYIASLIQLLKMLPIAKKKASMSTFIHFIFNIALDGLLVSRLEEY